MAGIIKKEGKSKIEKDNRYMARKLEREENYKALIANKFSDSFKYVSSEVVKDEKGRRHYYITVECIHCGEQKTSTYRTFNKSDNIKCMCQDLETVKKSAEKYAKTLYMSISSEASKLGFIMGEELEEYIRASTMYDRQCMSQHYKFLEYVYEYINDEYERRNVKQCSSCGLWLSDVHMYYYDRRICRECHKEKQKEKKKRRLEKEKRKLKGRR